ncbi:MAG: hypothetical protein ACP5UQ_00285 [Anaerolineae bacterium]
MRANSSRLCSSAGAEVLNDLLDDDLLQLQEDERLWKLYCFRSAEGQSTQLRHRIYTKIKPNGRLALITFAVHTPIAGRSVRSNIARVPDLPAEMLDRIIQAIVGQAHIAPDGFELLDLSGLPTLAEQWDALGA